MGGIRGLQPKSKIYLMTAMALWGGFASFYYEFLEDDGIVHIPILGKYGTVSLTGKMSNSTWILSLFLAKFAFNAWRKRDDQCIVLKRSPLIEWKKSSNSVAAAMLFVDTEYRAEHDTVAAVNEVVIHRGEE